MTEDKLDTAILEAKRFLDKAKASKIVYKTSSGFCGSKEHGAVKRASLDLTRALAEMRKP